MNRAAAVVLAVGCGHASTSTSETAAPNNKSTARIVTHMIVQLNEYYSELCKQQHHVQIAIDGVPVLTIESKIDCPAQQYSPDGHRIVVTDSGPNGYIERTFDVPPGHHTFDVTDLETHAKAHIEGEFPMYEGKAPEDRPVDHFGINVDDEAFHLLGFSYGFLSM